MTKRWELTRNSSAPDCAREVARFKVRSGEKGADAWAKDRPAGRERDWALEGVALGLIEQSVLPGDKK